MKNYAGHRLSPWLGHLMVSRQKTARPLLTPGEIMQLPPDDEIVLVSGVAPIRAKKARYYADPELEARILAPPVAKAVEGKRLVPAPTDDWSGMAPIAAPPAPKKRRPGEARFDGDGDNAGIRREPELPLHEAITPETPSAPLSQGEFEFGEEGRDEDETVAAGRLLANRFGGLARQATMDPADGLGL